MCKISQKYVQVIYMSDTMYYLKGVSFKGLTVWREEITMIFSLLVQWPPETQWLAYAHANVILFQYFFANIYQHPLVPTCYVTRYLTCYVTFAYY